jgi:hypothetical protein
MPRRFAAARLFEQRLVVIKPHLLDTKQIGRGLSELL